jgi:hypothetical protein
VGDGLSSKVAKQDANATIRKICNQNMLFDHKWIVLTSVEASIKSFKETSGKKSL